MLFPIENARNVVYHGNACSSRNHRNGQIWSIRNLYLHKSLGLHIKNLPASSLIVPTMPKIVWVFNGSSLGKSSALQWIISKNLFVKQQVNWSRQWIESLFGNATNNEKIFYQIFKSTHQGHRMKGAEGKDSSIWVDGNRIQKAVSEVAQWHCLCKRNCKCRLLFFQAWDLILEPL